MLLWLFVCVVVDFTIIAQRFHVLHVIRVVYYVHRELRCHVANVVLGITFHLGLVMLVVMGVLHAPLPLIVSHAQTDTDCQVGFVSLKYAHNTVNNVIPILHYTAYNVKPTLL